jgi:hypothetical protein
LALSSSIFAAKSFDVYLGEDCIPLAPLNRSKLGLSSVRLPHTDARDDYESSGGNRPDWLTSHMQMVLVLFSGDGSQFNYQCDSRHASYTITGVRDAEVCTGNRLCVLQESGIKKDEDHPVINESVMKMHACTPSQDALITLSNRTSIYPT